MDVLTKLLNRRFLPTIFKREIIDQLDSFITRMVQSGRYGSASEVMRSALRLLEQQESRDEAVRNAVIEGLESGESSMTLRDIAAERKQKHRV